MSTMYPEIDDKFQEETKREVIKLNDINPCTKIDCKLVSYQQIKFNKLTLFTTLHLC